MDLAKLRVFCEVYRQRGFSQAARKLKLTQSAVSQHISALERDLGVRLFDRTGPVSATAAGDHLFREGVALLASADDLRRSIRHVEGLGAGEVRFGMIDVAAIDLAAAALSTFRREHPQVKVETVVKASADLIDMVEAYELDFALAVANHLPEALRSHDIYSDSIVAIMPSRSPVRQKTLSVRDLREQPLILYPLSSHTRQVIEEAFRRQRIEPQVVMEMHYPAAICALVRQGMGIGLISALAAAENHLRGQVAIPLEELTGAMRIGVITHRRRRLSPQARALMEAMIQKT